MKDKRWFLPGILGLAFIVVLVWGFVQYDIKNDYKKMLNNEYQRLFYDMKDNVENVQVNLSKVLLAESKDLNILLLSQIWQHALTAQEKLSQMPVSHKDLSKTEKFLNQAADYCYSLIQAYLDGKPITSKQRHALFALQDNASYLSKELSDLHNKIMKGNLNFNLVRRREDRELDRANENIMNARLTKFEEKVTNNYPELIYDGPFSDQVLNVKPRGLGGSIVDVNEAKEIAKKFVGIKKVRKITKFEEGKKSNAANIEAYTFSISPENMSKERAIYISVSKKGGKIIWMMNPRPVNRKKLSINDALKYAKRFLEEKGYKSMEPNYLLKFDGVVLFNFAYKDDNVTIYADNIKVKVALDNGEIVGFDAAAYLKSHYDRDLPEPKLTEEEARDRVKLDFDIENVRLALIPKNGIKEILCYEFKGKYKGSNFIVYINAETGKEEKILKVIKDENGILMI